MNGAIINIVFSVGGLFVTLLLGYVFGKIGERKHMAQMEADDAALANVPVFNTHHATGSAEDSRLVMGSVVISIDYFRQFVARLIMLAGGRISYFEAPLERGRREAVLRMRKEAQNIGASRVVNLKLQSSPIGGPGQGTAVEIHACGTAIIEG